jgi:hypothetical protein
MIGICVHGVSDPDDILRQVLSVSVRRNDIDVLSKLVDSLFDTGPKRGAFSHIVCMVHDRASHLFRPAEDRRIFAAASVISQYDPDQTHVFKGFHKIQ